MQDKEKRRDGYQTKLCTGPETGSRIWPQVANWASGGPAGGSSRTSTRESLVQSCTTVFSCMCMTGFAKSTHCKMTPTYTKNTLRKLPHRFTVIPIGLKMSFTHTALTQFGPDLWYSLRLMPKTTGYFFGCSNIVSIMLWMRENTP